MIKTSKTRLLFGFALSDSMFAGFDKQTLFKRTPISPETAKAFLSSPKTMEVVPILNPSHAATIAAMEKRFGISVPIPPSPPKALLGEDDYLLVMQVQGLPRLIDRHEYTEEEIEKAAFTFSMWEVQ